MEVLELGSLAPLRHGVPSELAPHRIAHHRRMLAHPAYHLCSSHHYCLYLLLLPLM
jgi:hypothetical protein